MNVHFFILFFNFDFILKRMIFDLTLNPFIIILVVKLQIWLLLKMLKHNGLNIIIFNSYQIVIKHYPAFIVRNSFHKVTKKEIWLNNYNLSSLKFPLLLILRTLLIEIDSLITREKSLILVSLRFDLLIIKFYVSS